jgi:hypothetical protein
MVEIAQALGLNHIKSVDDVQDTKEGRVNKNLILEALKKARFSKGGYVDFSQSTIRGLNEDGIALVKRGEPILTVEQGKLFKELINNIKPLNNLVKLTRPNIENITKTDNSKSALTLNLYGTVTESMKPVLKDWTQEIAEIIRKK